MTKQIGVIAMVLVLVVSGVAWIPLAGASNGGLAALDSDQANETDEIAPGERLGAVIGVQNVELEGEIGERAFGIAIANASTDEERADIIAARLNETETRLDELEQRKATLEEQRENGEITHGKYRAEVAKLATEIPMTKRAANASAAHAGELPGELLEDRGINVTAIQTLAERADEMSGPEVAEIARSIAGDRVGERVGASVNLDREPGERPSFVENRTTDDAENSSDERQGALPEPAAENQNDALNSSNVTDVVDDTKDDVVDEDEDDVVDEDEDDAENESNS